MLFSKACDISGIVAMACARHGCFAPNSIVDLILGEEQKYVDWSLLQAILTTGVDPIQGLMLYYDIVCQYSVYLKFRIGHRLPPDLVVDRAIGLFHVHGHKESCFFRFSPSFIPESAVSSGEILESLWSNLNTITPSTRTATLAHRAEMIDEHATDSNHKKSLAIG
jgi:KDZ transposase-like protein